MRLLAALFCLLLLSSCSEPAGGGCAWYDSHGGIEPVLMVDGTLYRWTRLNGASVPL